MSVKGAAVSIQLKQNSGTDYGAQPPCVESFFSDQALPAISAYDAGREDYLLGRFYLANRVVEQAKCEHFAKIQ